MRTHWLVPRVTTRRTYPAFLAPNWSLASFDRIFENAWRGFGESPVASFSPKVDVEESDAELRISAELPGLEEKDFEITVDGDRLSIKGEKSSERGSEDEGDEGRHWVERSSGSFERSFRLAWEVDPDAIKAVFRSGVLEITIPKPAVEQPQVRTIPVTA